MRDEHAQNEPTEPEGISVTTQSMSESDDTGLDLQAVRSQAGDAKDLAVLDAPIQLVRPNPNGHEQLEVVEEGLKYLASVPSPLALIAVVGKFHTGKSFLLNQVMRKQGGFGVGRTVQPETMGIWMWGKVWATCM